MGSNACPFLRIPIELRLHIYSFALLDSAEITIGSSKPVGRHADIIERLYGDGRTPFQGLPENHEPVIETHYDASLLSITNPAIIPVSSTDVDARGTSGLPWDERLSLRLVNKQVNEELTNYLQKPATQRASIFASYPYGLHVLRNLTPHILRQAKSVHIAGTYVASTFNPAHAARLGQQREDHPGLEPRYNGHVKPNSASQLSCLVASLFRPGPAQPLRRLELRIYYPGEDSYSTVWGDDCSPVVLTLRNISSAKIEIEVWRGQEGTGV